MDGAVQMNSVSIYDIYMTYMHYRLSILSVVRKGSVLSSKPGLYEMAMPDDDQHTLKLLKVKSSDVGPMTCVASNKHGNDTCTFTIEMAGERRHAL